MTTKKYLHSYEARTRDILRQNNDITYSNGSIIATFQISFEAVESRNPAASKLLTLLGFLDNSDIWWELFNLAWRCHSGLIEFESALPAFPDTNEEASGDWLTDLAKDEVIFNQAISTLREFYFIRRNEANDSLSIHPVVHSWLRQRVSPQSWHSNLNVAITVLGRAVPFAHFEESWVLQRRLAVHAGTALDLVRAATTDKIDSPEGFHGLAVLMFDQSHFKAAEGLYRRAGEGWERRRGFDNWQTRRAYHDLGLAYRTLGKYKEAEALWKRLLEASIRTEGMPLTQGACRLLDDLGRLFTITKRYDEASLHFSQALEGRESHLQSNIARTAPEERVTTSLELALGDTCRHFGILKQAQGKLEEAETFYQRSLAIFKKQLGADHTWTLLVIADLGNISFIKGHFEQAEMYLRSALAAMEEHLGESHNYTVKLYGDLGKLLVAMGKREDGLILLDKAEQRENIMMAEGSGIAKDKR